AVCRLVEERHEVVHPGAERDALRPGAVLHVLLDAGVQVADGRAHLGDGLALQRQDQPEHPVGGRVLRAHVDDQPLAALEVLGLVGGGDELVPVLAGCPSKMIPKKSQVSRSCQLQVGYTPTSEGICGSASGAVTSSRTRRLWVIDSRW